MCAISTRNTLLIWNPSTDFQKQTFKKPLLSGVHNQTFYVLLFTFRILIGEAKSVIEMTQKAENIQLFALQEAIVCENSKHATRLRWSERRTTRRGESVSLRVMIRSIRLVLLTRLNMSSKRKI